MTLYEIDNSIKAFLDGLIDAADENGEVGEVDFTALEQLKQDRQTKLENIALYVKNLESDAAAIKAEEEALKARRTRLENKADGLRWLLLRSLTANGDTELSTPKCCAKIKTTESTEIINVDLIPEKYVKITTEKSADKNAIKKAIKAGEVIEGAVIVKNTKVRIE